MPQIQMAFDVSGLRTGVDKARAILAGRPDLEALLVYEEDGQMRTYQTDKIKTQ